ncbi:MAG: hypothetical protein EBY16_00265 [Gammaproteobacteria bacterium]|nr:hypothetical protein [Gammaproteobacteria bacterium]
MKTCEIDDKISNLKKYDSLREGEELLKVVEPYARAYIAKLREYNLLPTSPTLTENYSNQSPQEVHKNITLTNKLPFFVWINRQAHFKEAKNRLVENKLISADLDSIQANSHFSYAIQQGIEFVVANAICHCVDNISHLKAVNFVPIERTRLMEKYEPELYQMSRNFELDIEEHLFVCLLNRLKKSSGNIYNSGRPSIRELLTKRIMQGVFWSFSRQKLTATFVADLTNEIIGRFFTPIARNSAISIAGAIKNQVQVEIECSSQILTTINLLNNLKI